MRRTLLNTVSVLLAASTVAAATSFAASAQEVSVVGNVAYVSDYRFRGVSLSDTDMALQGGFDLSFADSGFYAGTWASSIQPYGGAETEVDLYAGYKTTVGAFTLDGGLYGYTYPGSEDTAYYEVYGKASTSLGMVGLTGGINWAPEQSNVLSNYTGEEEDNTYFFLDGALPLGDSAFSLTGHVGYEDGALVTYFDDSGEDDKTDWAVGVATKFLGLDVGVQYIDTSEDGDLTDATGVLTIKKVL